MQRKPGLLLEGGSAGGRGGPNIHSKPPGSAPPSQSPFKLKKAPVYEIWRRKDSFGPEKKIGTATSLKSAHRVIDRRDNEYGGYAHFKKKIGE